MTVSLAKQEEIRQLEQSGVSQREIAKRLASSRDTVAKYVNQVDFSPKPPQRAKRPGASVLTSYEAIIDHWLHEDQQRSAREVFHRLVSDHGYPGSYSPVQRYVKQWRAEHQFH